MGLLKLKTTVILFILRYTQDNKTSISIFEDSFINYATLHVPSESIDAYKSAEVWNGFKSIIGL